MSQLQRRQSGRKTRPPQDAPNPLEQASLQWELTQHDDDLVKDQPEERAIRRQLFPEATRALEGNDAVEGWAHEEPSDDDDDDDDGSEDEAHPEPIPPDAPLFQGDIELKHFPVQDSDIGRLHLRQLITLDVEFHDRLGTVCEFCALSWDAQIQFHRYVFLNELHPDWQDLIDRHGVTQSPWDDPRQAQRFDEVWKAFLDVVPKGAILLFKGSIDMRRIVQSLSDVETARQITAPKKLRYASIDSLWRSLAKEWLPEQTRKRILTGSGVKRLHQIYDALFWNPVLVHIPPEHDREELVQWELPPDEQIRLVRNTSLDRIPPMSFLATGHHAPAFHTANVDVIVTHNVTCFLLLHALHRKQMLQVLHEEVCPGEWRLRHDRAAVHDESLVASLLATRVAVRTRCFRKAYLMPPLETVGWAWDTIQVKARSVMDALGGGGGGTEDVSPEDAPTQPHILDDDEPPSAADAVHLPRPQPNLAPSVVAARKLRTQSKGVPVLHDGRWHLAYTPIWKGQDAIKLRAVQDLIGFRKSGKTVFDRLETEHRRIHPEARRTIGDRPWYYQPSATGRQFPRTQVLHTRRCLDRYNGQAYGVAPDESSDAWSFYDFDLPRDQLVLNYTLVFCKSCKKYKDDAVPFVAVSPPPSPVQRQSLGEWSTTLLLLTVLALKPPPKRSAEAILHDPDYFHGHPPSPNEAMDYLRATDWDQAVRDLREALDHVETEPNDAVAKEQYRTAQTAMSQRMQRASELAPYLGNWRPTQLGYLPQQSS